MIYRARAGTWVPMALAWVLPSACGPQDPGADDDSAGSAVQDDTTADDDTTLGAADDWHLLASADGWGQGADHTLVEFNEDLDPVWVYDAPSGRGAEGIQRLDDGSTVYTEVPLDGGHDAAVVLLDREGGESWRFTADTLGGLENAHGVAVTRQGDFVIADTDADRVLAVDSQGALLWELAELSTVNGSRSNPNGLSLALLPDGVEGLLVSMRAGGQSQPGTAGEAILLYTLAEDRGTPPERRWIWPQPPSIMDLSIPHGPQLATDGSATICSTLQSVVIGIDAAGAELWRVPGDDAVDDPGEPRDAVLTPDGDLLVGNSTAGEILRVQDPFGSFVIGDRADMPGVFALRWIDCRSGVGTACLVH